MNKTDKKIRESSLLFVKKNKQPQTKQALNISIQPNIILDEKFFLKTKFKGFECKVIGKGVETVSSKEFMLSEIIEFIEPKDWLYHANRFSSQTVLFLRITEKLLEPLTLEIDFKKLPAIGSIYILGEKNSSALIIIQKNSESKTEAYLGLNLNVLAKENSNIEIVQMQNYSKGINAIEKKVASIDKNASVEWHEIVSGSSFTNSDTKSYLSKDFAKTIINSCFALKNNEKTDISTSAIHDAKNTESTIITRGLANGNSKALSQGLIKINKNANGSSGFEKQDALILSETAQADAIPNLEILNNDVKCSHSSSVGQIDSEKLFYLTSRGLSDDEAKKLIIQGYFSNLIDKVPNLARLEFEEKINKAVDDLF